MSYGTSLFPRLHKQGSWVLQTDREEIIDLMQERHWNAKSPWTQCLQYFIRIHKGLLQCERRQGVSYKDIE